MMLFNQLIQSYRQHLSNIKGKRVWLACSGGRDSMALAFATFQLYQQGVLPFCPQLIHVNHGLQSCNDDWAQLVLNWAKNVGMPCYLLKADLTGSNELSARLARYESIIQLMNHNDVLILAHHANDQAETVLMRLFSGAGVTGLSGMREWTTYSNNRLDKQIYLWRPWLMVNREYISKYAMQESLPYVDDPTNLVGDNVRAWLRSEILPSIKKSYPQVVNTVVRNAQLLHDAESILEEVYYQDLKLCENKGFQENPYCLVLDVNHIKKLSFSRQRQLIHKWMQGYQHELEPTPPSKHRVEEILGLIHRTDNDQQTELKWQGDNYQYSVRRYRNHLYRLRSDWLKLLQSNEIWKTPAGLLQISRVSAKFPSSLYHIRSLAKEDKVSLNYQQLPKSGKKLMQQLGIPSWERQSVKVIVNNANGQMVAIFTLKHAWYKKN